MSVLAGCGGEFQPKLSRLSIGVHVLYLQVNMEVFTSAFKELRINAVCSIVV